MYHCGSPPYARILAITGCEPAGATIGPAALDAARIASVAPHQVGSVVVAHTGRRTPSARRVAVEFGVPASAAYDVTAAGPAGCAALTAAAGLFAAGATAHVLVVDADPHGGAVAIVGPGSTRAIWPAVNAAQPVAAIHAAVTAAGIETGHLAAVIPVDARAAAALTASGLPRHVATAPSGGSGAIAALAGALRREIAAPGALVLLAAAGLGVTAQVVRLPEPGARTPALTARIDRADVIREVRAAIRAVRLTGDVRWETPFRSGLRADSLAIAEVVVEVEERLGVLLPGPIVDDLDTVGDLVTQLCRRLERSA